MNVKTFAIVREKFSGKVAAIDYYHNGTFHTEFFTDRAREVCNSWNPVHVDDLKRQLESDNIEFVFDVYKDYLMNDADEIFNSDEFTIELVHNSEMFEL